MKNMALFSGFKPFSSSAVAACGASAPPLQQQQNDVMSSLFKKPFGSIAEPPQQNQTPFCPPPQPQSALSTPTSIEPPLSVLSTPTSIGPPHATTWSTQTSQVQKLDAQVQTEASEKIQRNAFKCNKEVLKKKAFAVCLLTCFKKTLAELSSVNSLVVPAKSAQRDEIERLWHDDASVPISDVHLGVVALMNWSSDDLMKKFTTNTDAIVCHVRLVGALIEESIETVNELYQFLARQVKNKVLSLAIKLARRDKPTVFEPLSPTDFWTECLAIAISIFAAHDNRPLEAIDAALKLTLTVGEAKRLIVHLVCDLVGASYGIDALPKEWSTAFADYEDVMYISKKLVTTSLSTFG